MNGTRKTNKSGKLVIMSLIGVFIVLLVGRQFLLDQTTEIDPPAPSHFPNRFDRDRATVQRASLGKMLFHDPLLSLHQQISCASCHQQAAAYADPGKSTSTGDLSVKTERNSPTLVNLAWKKQFFADGRATKLEETIENAVLDPKELNSDFDCIIIPRIRKNSLYSQKFRRLFGNRTIHKDDIILVLTDYLRTLNSFHAKYDEVMQGRAQFTTQEKEGLEIFTAACQSCHVPPLFHSQGLISSCQSGNQDKNALVAPTLRNIEFTSPYGYTGAYPRLDSLLIVHEIQWAGSSYPRTVKEVAALKAFLYTLSDHSFTSNTAY